MAACRVWIRLDLPDKEWASLEQAAPACEFWRGDDASVEVRRPQEIDAVFTEEPLSDSLVEAMSNLKWLHVTRGGVGAYLTPAVKRRPIQVTSSKGIHGPSFSEFALACMFALAKKLPQCWEAQSRRKWQRQTPEDLAGKTAGIVGLGTVGTALAQKAKALGLRVIATKRTVAEKPDEVDELGPPEFLPSLLAQSDFVVLCLASIPSTINMIGERELRSMKKSAYLINLTGGKVIEEKLLARALKERWIAGAALDALPRQPLPEDSELWGLPNVIVTPRIGGVTAQKWSLLLPVFVENLKRYAAGEPLRHVVDKELGY
jgi:phosphoglycerate dehydrogenase-like enzyme